MRFALRCGSGHDFEAWFGGNEDFEMQRGRDLVSCPLCGSTAVAKALMAPGIATARSRDAERGGAGGREPGEGGREPGEGAMGDRAEGADHAALRKRLNAFARFVRENTTDVGDRFPEEARRIHQGEAEERAIRGRASPEEARELVGEGVPIAPLPAAPETAN